MRKLIFAILLAGVVAAEAKPPKVDKATEHFYYVHPLNPFIKEEKYSYQHVEFNNGVHCLVFQPRSGPFCWFEEKKK